MSVAGIIARRRLSRKRKRGPSAVPSVNGDLTDEDDQSDSLSESSSHPVVAFNDDNRDDPDDSQDSSSDESESETQAEKDRKTAFFDSDTAPSKIYDSFLGMSVSRPILKALTSLGFHQPTPIQAATIPVALLGKDVVGGAVTGSGKTAAFIIPMLERLLYREKGKGAAVTRCLVLVPTRELAVQCFEVGTKLATHTDIRFCVIVGEPPNCFLVDLTR